MIEEFFNLYKLYELKPRDFSQNSFILSKTSSCTPVNSIQKWGVKVSLLTKKDPSPSMNPNSQLFVILIGECFWSIKIKTVSVHFIL